MQIITAKTELFSDVVRAAVEYNMAPEILVAGLNSNDSNAVLIAANSMSNTLNRQKVWMALLHLLQTNQIFSFNYATFERLYREAYQFSSQDARAICGKSNLDEQATQVCELIKSW